MRQFMERLLRSVDPPDPERAERLWAEYRAGGAKADTAFATLMAWYGGTIYRRIWGFVRSDAAEDVFQDVLVRLHRRRHRFADFEHALRWLRGVAMTQSLNARRGEARRTTRERTRAVGGTETSEAATAELGEALRAALVKLSDREREAVALVYFEGMTRQDGAAALGVHRDTLAKLLDTALGRLKAALTAAVVGTAVTTAGVETALAVNPGLTLARLSVLAEAAWVNARGSGFAWLPARRLVPLILAGGLLAVAAAATFSRSRPMARTPTAPSVRLQAERLEPREVPSADFVSALGLGNDTGASSANDVAVDAAGNSYKVGSFSGTLDFDPANTRPGDTDILTSAGDRDIFVAKYTPNDALVWAVRMGGVGYDIGKAIDVDEAGNVHVTGSFNGGDAQFGSTSLTSAGLGNDGFVAKLDLAGSALWAKRWGQTEERHPANSFGDQGVAIDTDAAGNVYVVGTRLTYPAVSSSTIGYDILKYTPTGAAVSGWPKYINTKLASLDGDLVADANGNVFVTGDFKGTVDFDPHPTKTKTMTGGSPASNAFVVKLTSAGNFGWVSTFSYGWGQSLARDASGNVFVGGFYHSASPSFSRYGGPSSVPTNLPYTAGNSGAFIAKLTSDAGLTWVKGLAQTSSTAGARPKINGLAVDAAGSVYATGDFVGTIDLDPGAGTLLRQSKPLANGTGPSQDVYVVKLTAAGNLAWAETFGGDGADIAHGVAVDPSGLVHLAGSYRGTVDFDPDPIDTFHLTNPNTHGHLFFVKLRQN